MACRAGVYAGRVSLVVHWERASARVCVVGCLHVLVKDPHSRIHSSHESAVPPHEPFPRQFLSRESGRRPMVVPASRSDQLPLPALQPLWTMAILAGSDHPSCIIIDRHAAYSIHGSRSARGCKERPRERHRCHEERTELATATQLGDVGSCKVNPVARVARQSAPHLILEAVSPMVVGGHRSLGTLLCVR